MSFAYDEASQGVLVETGDGEHVLIDPITLEASSVSLGRTHPRVGIRRGPQLVKSTDQLSIRQSGFYNPTGAFPVRLDPEWEIYDARFVVDEMRDDYLRISDPESLVLTHTEDHSENARRLLARG